MKPHPVVVVCERPGTVADVLPRLGEDAHRALEEGRLFVGKRRVLAPSEPVRPGEQMQIYPRRTAPHEPPQILLEEDGVVAAYKPAEMATVADHRGASGTLEREVARLLGSRAAAVTATSRLDVGVSGVVLFATTDAARSALALARKQGRYRRHYVAISTSAPEPHQGLWTAPIGHGPDPRRRSVGGRDSVAAETRYAVASQTARAALLTIEPITGRTHQIRVHAAHAGCPLLGDAAYGGPTRLVSEFGAVRPIQRIALHAAWVDVDLSGFGAIHAEAPVPVELRTLWVDVGGEASAWNLAVEPLGAPRPISG